MKSEGGSALERGHMELRFSQNMDTLFFLNATCRLTHRNMYFFLGEFKNALIKGSYNY